MKSKVALITGASSGIGAATAERLAKADYKVFGTSRRAGRHRLEDQHALLGDDLDALLAAAAQDAATQQLQVMLEPGDLGGKRGVLLAELDDHRGGRRASRPALASACHHHRIHPAHIHDRGARDEARRRH